MWMGSLAFEPPIPKTLTPCACTCTRACETLDVMAWSEGYGDIFYSITFLFFPSSIYLFIYFIFYLADRFDRFQALHSIATISLRCCLFQTCLDTNNSFLMRYFQTISFAFFLLALHPCYIFNYRYFHISHWLLNLNGLCKWSSDIQSCFLTESSVWECYLRLLVLKHWPCAAYNLLTYRNG